MKKKPHGGKRKGAGKPLKYGEPTVHLSFRVPKSKATEIKIMIKYKLKTFEK